jgi:hypothetical protein
MNVVPDDNDYDDDDKLMCLLSQNILCAGLDSSTDSHQCEHKTKRSHKIDELAENENVMKT